MSNLSLVSVIIPCYQAEKTLENTLNDIFNQTYQNIEIIAVNDGSTDNTQQILNKYHDKIKIVNQSNKGASAARNRGFEESKGNFILFCDADINLKKNMIEKMTHILIENPNKSYCYSNFKFGIHTFDLFPFDPDRLRKENYISTMSLIRKECFIGFNESLKRFQDWDLWKRMLDKGYEGVWYPERLFIAPMAGGISKYSFKNFLKIIKRRLFG